jgi:hypothetical protein
VIILHECAVKKRFPTVEELLQLMDANRPAVGMRYLDKLDAFQDMDLNNIVDVYSLPVELLATIGDTGRTAAHHIHVYCKDKLLDPLRYLMSDSTDSAAGSDSEIPDFRGGGLSREGTRQRVLRWAEDIRRASEEEKEAKVAEGKTEFIEVTDDEEDGSVEVATRVSCEV